MKISISVNEELLKEIEEAAKQLNVNRSVFFTLAAQEKIKNDKIVSHLPKFTELMQMAYTQNTEKEIKKLKKNDNKQ